MLFTNNGSIVTLAMRNERAVRVMTGASKVSLSYYRDMQTDAATEPVLWCTSCRDPIGFVRRVAGGTQFTFRYGRDRCSCAVPEPGSRTAIHSRAKEPPLASRNAIG